MLNKIKYLAIASIVFSGIVYALLVPAPVLAALPPAGCTGGPSGPSTPGVSCPYTSSQVYEYCSNPSSLPPGSSVFCDTNGGGLVEINQSSQPVTNPSAAGPSGVNVPAGSDFDGDCKPGAGVALDKTNCGIIAYLLAGINVLSASVGVIVVIMIAIGGMQYSAARDNPQAVAAARGRIINALMGLLAYLFMYALLQYLVPGGVL